MQDYYFNLDKRRMAEEGIGAGEMFAAIRPVYGRNMEIGSVVTEEGAEKEGFWFPLAAGTIGGLVMSVIGVFIFLPVLTLKRKN